MMGAGRPAGVILAGGRSSRMGGKRKALLELHGRSLLSYVINSLQPHLHPLMLSCESETEDFDDFGLPVIADLAPGFRGPLTGLCSALQYLAGMGHVNGLILCPCDAPFIPGSLTHALREAAQGKEKPVVVVSYEGVLQPTFSLWQSHHLPFVYEALVNQGVGGLNRVLTSLPHTVVEWASAEPPPFFNVNTPEDLESAANWLDRASP
jgi:molybdopterin-guanine dinucleotide biosynthesis protein A